MPLIQFNSEQKMIQNEVRKFALSELEPIASDIDKESIFPTDIVKKLAELGLSSLIIPEKYGGADLDTTCLCIAVEELAKVSASVSLILAVNNCLVAYPMIKYGVESTKAQYLGQLSKGDVGGYVVETGFESNERKIEQQEKEGVVSIAGLFDFVLNGEAANFIVLPVEIEEGKTIFIFDKKTNNGISKHRILGMRAAGIVSLKFKPACLISGKHLAAPQESRQVLQDIQNYSDIIFSAISLGIAEASYDAAIRYSKERRQFGRAICEFPMVQEMLVDMKTKITASRFLVYDAAAKADTDQVFALSAHIARLFASQAAVSCGLNAIQVHGGYGYTKEYPVERHMRDAKTIQLLSATPIDLKSVLAKELL